jgi:hypothetical protein
VLQIKLLHFTVTVQVVLLLLLLLLRGRQLLLLHGNQLLIALQVSHLLMHAATDRLVLMHSIAARFSKARGGYPGIHTPHLSRACHYL